MTSIAMLPVPSLPAPPLPGAGDVVGGITKAGVRAALSGITEWVAEGAAGLVRAVAALVDRVVEPRLGSEWFLAHVRDMAAIAALLVLPLVIFSVFAAIIRQDAGLLLRTIGFHLPVAALATMTSVVLVQLALAVTDDLCSMVTHSETIGAGPFLSGLGANLERAPQLSGGGEFGVVVVAVVLAVGAFGLAIELWMRTAAIYVTVLFLPLALAGTVWPATARWARRLVELLAVLILSKFVIVAIISLGSSAVVLGLDRGDLSGLIAGAALLMLAVFAPFTLLRLVPIVEAGAVGHLEGVGRRLVPGAETVPRPFPILDSAPDGARASAAPAASGPAPSGVGIADYPSAFRGAPGRVTTSWDALRARSAAERPAQPIAVPVASARDGKGTDD